MEVIPLGAAAREEEEEEEEEEEGEDDEEEDTPTAPCSAAALKGTAMLSSLFGNKRSA
jgi:hypothetical protein